MDKEVLNLMWLKKRMRKRFALIYRWLKDAEQDYSKDRKTEGELNLLLAQAEVRRAWEISQQEAATNQELQKVKGPSNYIGKLLTGICLSVCLVGLFFFHFPFQSQVTNPSPVNHSSSKPVANLATMEEKNFLSSPQPVVEQEKAEEVKKQQHITSKINESPYQEKAVAPPKTIKVEKKPVATNQVIKPIQVDVVDLVQEAERSLYQPTGGQVQH